MRYWEAKNVHCCYTTFLHHAWFNHSANTLPSTEGNCQGRLSARETEGMIPFFLNLLGNGEITLLWKGRGCLWMKGGGKITQEFSGESTSEPRPASTSAVETSSSTPARGSVLCSADWSLHLSLHHCGHHLWGVWPFRSLVSTIWSDYKVPKLIYIYYKLCVWNSSIFKQ